MQFAYAPPGAFQVLCLPSGPRRFSALLREQHVLGWVFAWVPGGCQEGIAAKAEPLRHRPKALRPTEQRERARLAAAALMHSAADEP